jgi:cation diffusion facilitator family transporter
MVAGADRARLLTRDSGFGIRDLTSNRHAASRERAAALDPDPTHLANPESRIPNPDRYAEVAGVLTRVLLLNLVIAVAKIAFGYASGAISVLSDGFHSLTDAASNVVGLVGVRAAGRPPDADHPYGHRKYETVAAAAVNVFLLLVIIEVLRNAFNHLTGRVALHDIGIASFVVMLVTVAINLAVVAYESREANRLASEVLLADATQTRGDVWSSVTVITALVGARAGVPILDPIAALVVAGFIAHAAYQVARATTGILSDRIVISDADLQRVVMSVPGVLGCHRIRTRGAADHVFLDLHVWLPADMRLHDAHDLSHVVKDRLMARYPQIADAVIHIEPPPPADRDRPAGSGVSSPAPPADRTAAAVLGEAGPRTPPRR